IMDDWGSILEEMAFKQFREKFGRDPDLTGPLVQVNRGDDDRSELMGILGELQDQYRVPVGGEPVETPFMDDGWIRHELQKNLLEAAEQGDEGLAVIHPENIRGRYADNPGLGKFYE